MGRSRLGRGAGRGAGWGPGLRLKAGSGVRDRGRIGDAATLVEVLGSRPDLGFRAGVLGSRLDSGLGSWPMHGLGFKAQVSGIGSQTHA